MRSKQRRVRDIAVVTTGRSDYGLLKPVIDALRRTRGVRTRLLVTGMHLSERLGRTVDAIDRDGLRRISEPIEVLVDADTPSAVAKSIGLATIGFAQVFQRGQPDVLVVLGDRFEALGAVSAALPFNIAIAHIHGGESTEGAIDEGVRHAITKMSHLHFVSTAQYARRLRQMGEESWRIVISGAPGLDNIAALRPASRAELSARIGLPIDRETLLVTYHPETLRPTEAAGQVEELLQALDRLRCPVIFTSPNADPGRDAVHRRIQGFVAGGGNRALVTSLGQRDYLSLLRVIGAMVGNSSSGIIEAPSFGLPVVNVGARQGGRLRAPNVIDVDSKTREIEHGVARALDPRFRAKLKGLRNPYGHGRAGSVIARRLAAVPLDAQLLAKRFVDRVKHRHGA